MALALDSEVSRPRLERKRIHQPLLSSLGDEKTEFKKWLKLTAVNSGMYRLTRAGVANLVASSSGVLRNKKDRGLAAATFVDSIVKTGDDRRILNLVEQGIITPRPDWSKRQLRLAAIRKLVSIKPAVSLIKDDFIEFGLEAMLRRYRSSPTAALVDAGYVYSESELRLHSKAGEFKTEKLYAGDFKEDKLYPWQRKMASMHFYENEGNRVAALKWTAWKTGNPLAELTKSDAREGCVYSLFQQPYLEWTHEFLAAQNL
ncbi:hypothetical protein HZC08_00055 [Candidatus Micrarchaeota archaeon]|nr:hypothetical protein [Candidatus Micrarchaeota archaeon]